MAEALRFALSRGQWLAAVPVALVFGPLLPGLFWALVPALDGAVWLDLWADAQWPQALRATLVSSVLGSALALAMAMLLASWHYPGTRWLTLQRRLPLLLALPHAAFAVGLFFLLAPSGWLARGVAQLMGWVSPPDWITVQDPYGLSLALALAIKESWFLLWVLAALLGEQPVRRQMVVARSLGYSRAQAWRLILWPQLLPRLGWPLAAVLAYGLSVVDMAIILGPGTPPTLAVLVWRWLTDPEPALQARGSAASLVLLALLLLAAALARGLLAVACRQRRPYPNGLRQSAPARARAEPAHAVVFDGLCGAGRVAALVVCRGLVFSGAVARQSVMAELADMRIGHRS